MRLRIAAVPAVVAALMLLSPLQAGAANKGTSKVNDSIDVLEQIMSIPEKGIPPALLRNAHGIAIIPGVIKAGFIIGGKHGTGIVVVRENGEWSNPAFVSITGGSVGWQIGAESTDVILVFKTRRGIDSMLKSKFTLGADAAVAAGPVGRQAGAGTDVQLKAEIYSYSRSRGLFAGISLEGASLQVDDEADDAFYGQDGLRARDILSDKNLKAPAVVKRLKKVLERYTR
jgi:lipid-binding SYLF domain-containing protein